MRGMLLALALVMGAGVTRADVVFSNLSSGTGTTTSNFAINFKVTTPGSSITQFFVGTNNNPANKTADFLLTGGGSLRGTGSYVSDFQGSGVGGVLWDISTLGGANSLDPATSYTLTVVNQGGMTFSTTTNSITNNPSFGFYDTSYGGSFVQFAVVGVPEPGTLLLGGIAAACGGGGVWWRRKRKAAPVADEAVVAE